LPWEVFYGQERQGGPKQELKYIVMPEIMGRCAEYCGSREESLGGIGIKLFTHQAH
jgi:hypothetical protein